MFPNPGVPALLSRLSSEGIVLGQLATLAGVVPAPLSCGDFEKSRLTDLVILIIAMIVCKSKDYKHYYVCLMQVRFIIPEKILLC